MSKFETADQCLEQIAYCGYKTPEGLPLENNAAFIRLVEIANSTKPLVAALEKIANICETWEEASEAIGVRLSTKQLGQFALKALTEWREGKHG